jgi:hypothetical protein
MKTIILTIVFLLVFPATLGIEYPHSFNSWKDYSQFWELQRYHGALTVKTDFSGGFRCSNGEEVNLRK